MSKTLRVATLGPRPPITDTNAPPAKIAGRMKEIWRRELDQVLPDQPQLIVIPEASDRPADMPVDRRIEYYRSRGDSLRDFFAQLAAEHACHIVYSAIREHPDGTFRNASELIDAAGVTVATYNKNHVVIEETTEGGILCGSEAPVFETELGRIAFSICFDLNFDELRAQYVEGRPQLVLFSSMYHGGLMQAYWAYSCRSYFVGAVAGGPSEIRNPFGEVVASSTNYRDYSVADINLDFCLAHLDCNQDRFERLKRAYGPEVSIYDPGYVGSVLVTSLSAEVTAAEMAREFEIELLDDYFQRALDHHHAHRG